MSEMQVRVRPEELQIREQQRQQRLAIGHQLEEDKKIEQEPRVFLEPFTFRFRKISNGSFAGLWELAAMRSSGKVDEIIIDADSLPNILDAVGNIFANKGY